MADLPAWIFASSCLIGFLLFAGYNGFIAWSNFVLSASTPSYAPVTCRPGELTYEDARAYFR